MNKTDAELLLQKEEQRKKKIAERMYKYRNNDEYRKKNADYMKEYREKQKKLLEEAKKVVQENTSDKNVTKKINIIQKINVLLTSKSLDKTIINNIFNNNIDKSYEKYVLDNMPYLKNPNGFIDSLKKEYTNIKTLKTNVLPFLLILKKVNNQYYSLLNTVYKKL